MKGLECKLPMQEDSSFLNNERMELSRHKKILIVAGLLLLITISLMIGFNFKSLSEISELRQEIEQLKSSLQYLHKKVNDHFDVPEYTEELTEAFKSNLDDYDDTSYYDDNNYNDMSYYNDYDVYSDDNLDHILTGEDFTKDAKIATTPPRIKRNIDGNTQDSRNAINSEEARRKNLTDIKNRNYPFTTSTPTSQYTFPVYSRVKIQQDVETHQTTPVSKLTHRQRARSVHQENKRQVLRLGRKSNFLKSGDSQYSGENADVDFTVVRDDQLGSGRTRHRQRGIELDERSVRTERMRPLPTAHFNGNSSNVVKSHENFDEHGHLRHPQKAFVDWAESSWFRTLGMDQYYSLSNDGILTIKESGLYFVYAQIYYLDEHDTNGFRVYKNEDGTFLQCTTTAHTNPSDKKGNSCFTASAEYLNENDRISVRDISTRYCLFEPGKSFFGVIKLGDVKIK